MIFTKMQENNNFETIIGKWRRISDDEKIEKKEAFESISMPGDLNHPPFADKKEEPSLYVPEIKASTSVAIIGAGAAAASELPDDKSIKIEEKQDLIKHDDSKNASGDGDDNSDDYIENEDKVVTKAPASQNSSDDPGDNVDSVFLRPPPPHKRRPATPVAEEEEDCGIKCLYYALQCCDCVLM